ncbi:MAG: tail fiber assembly protein [Pantoea sp.]|nr:tail fiber assembly protein [Pantoea sp.]
MTTETIVTLDANGLAEISGILSVYNFEPDTGVFTGSSQEFLAQGVGIPAHSTSDAPPDDVKGMVCLFRNGKWQQVADHRGETVYSKATGAAVVVTQPGGYPDDTTTLKPATKFDTWGGAAWVTDAAAQREAAVAASQTEKNSRISEAGSITQVWQTQLALGIITDADKVSLTAWMKYLQAVQAVDVSGAPDISWPDKPQ